jgi:putative transcriptional regulator
MIGAVGSLTGHLLLSNASLFDPNFRRTVVLVGHHDEEGAVGVVLNRPFDVTVGDVVPPLAALVPPGEPLFHGGPVQPEAAVVVADFADPSKAGVIAFGTIGFLAEEVDVGESGVVRRARVYAGYSGWGPGQLESELAEDAWLVTAARPEDVFLDDPDLLWDQVLARLGRGYAFMRTMPFDPSSN